VQKVDSTKGTGDKRIDRLPVQVDLGLGADMREDVVVAQLDEGKLAVVGVGAKVLLTVSSPRE
jgi:hypothetical protein